MTMTDYIKREDAMTMPVLPWPYRDYAVMQLELSDGELYEMGWRDAIDNLQNLPAANVRENVPGEWIERHVNVATPETDIFCSVCGWPAWNQHTNFCPNCGADMRGEKDEPR